MKYTALLMMFLLSAATTRAQLTAENPRASVPKTRYLTGNEEAVAIFNELCAAFPNASYCVNERVHKVDYRITETFWTGNDYEVAKTLLTNIWERSLKLDYLQRYTHESEWKERFHHLTADLKCEVYRQNDYLDFNWTEEGFEFIYRVNNQPYAFPQRRAYQNIADKIEKAFGKYTKRKDARKEAVEYQGNKYKLYTFCGGDFNKLYSAGTRYIIPKCTEEDYKELATLIKSFSLTNDVSVLCSDVYQKYEQIGLCCFLDNGREVSFGVALKGTDLYLIRTESEVDGYGLLPRAWAEDSPIWKD